MKTSGPFSQYNRAWARRKGQVVNSLLETFASGEGLFLMALVDLSEVSKDNEEQKVWPTD